MRLPGLVAALAVLGACGRIGFDPGGDGGVPGGGVEEADLMARPIIASSQEFTCVRRGDGSVWCWGDGRWGALGNGTEQPRADPARVANLPPAVAIVAGSQHACALDDSGGVWCWGENTYGQLDGNPEYGAAPPTLVPLPRPALTISAGTYHTCAVLDDNSVACWGKNSRGQLGKGPIAEAGRMELDVVANATAVAAGAYHTCAIVSGLVSCWGHNEVGQLGDGTDMEALVPTGMPGIPASAIAAAYEGTCALADGRYRCWGNNGADQLGGPTTIVNTPAPPSTLTGIVALRMGFEHTCALRDDRSVWCWGQNRLGALGDNTANGNSFTTREPVRVANLGEMADVATGLLHACAVAASGEVACWGGGRFGQLGNPARMAMARPQTVPLPGPAQSVAAGAEFACAVLVDQEALYCWGRNTSGQLSLPAGGLVSAPFDTGMRIVTSYGLGTDHMCARVDGTASCWGSNEHGQLGDGTTTSRHTPAAISVVVTKLSVGQRYACGTDMAGNSFCWGANDYDRIVGGVGGDVLTPMGVMSGDRIAAGIGHTCAVSSGDVFCWGWNGRGQIGSGGTSVIEPPTQATAGGEVFEIVAPGAEHTCAETPGGELYCWGMNQQGALGVGDWGDRDVPTSVGAGRLLATSWYHTCAEIGGSAACWGQNYTGQLGDGTFDDRNQPATVVDAPAGVVSVATGMNFTCMVNADNEVRCWGDNTYGQLGINTVGFAAAPEPVAFTQ